MTRGRHAELCASFSFSFFNTLFRSVLTRMRHAVTKCTINTPKIPHMTLKTCIAHIPSFIYTYKRYLNPKIRIKT